MKLTLHTYKLGPVTQHCTDLVNKPSSQINCRSLIFESPTIESLVTNDSNWSVENGIPENVKFSYALIHNSKDRVILENENLLVTAEDPNGDFGKCTGTKNWIIRFHDFEGNYFLGITLDKNFEIEKFWNNYVSMIYDQRSIHDFINPPAEELATNWTAHALLKSLRNPFVADIYNELGLPDPKLIEQENTEHDNFINRFSF